MRIARGTLLLLLTAALAGAQTNVDLDLIRGTRQVEEGDLEGGIATLDGVVRKLSTLPGRGKDLAQAYLYQGVAYVALDQERAARASFREALKLDRTLRLDATRHSPRMLRVFEATLQELGPAPPSTPAPPRASPETFKVIPGTTTPDTLPTPRPTESSLPSGPRPTSVVDAGGGGDFTSLAEAVRRAAPGSVVQVRAGLYAEALVLDKPIEIVGDGKVQVVSTGAAVVVVKSDGVVLRGITLRALPGAMRDFFAVDVGVGRLTLENCDVSSEVLAVVAVRGSAEAVLKGCKIHDGRAGGGVFVLEDGRVTLVESVASSNRYAGIEAKDRAVVTVQRSILRDNATSGLLLKGNATATVEDSEVMGNAQSGVEVSGSATATLRNCKIHDGKGSGVLVAGGRAQVEGGELYANRSAQLDVRGPGSEAAVSRCKIHDGAANGVAVHDQARATIEDTEVWGHASAEVWVYRGADPVLRRCVLHDSKSAGVFVDQDGRGTFEDCDIAKNALAGVQVTTGGNPTLRRSKIHESQSNGVFCYERGAVQIEDSEIFGNGYAGVQVKTGTGSLLRRCRITGHPHHAIWAEWGAGITVENCDLRGNRAGAFLTDSGAVVKASGNQQ